jgi:hypothetical protein
MALSKILYIVIGLAVVGGGAWWALSGGTTQSAENPNTETATSSDSPETFSGNFQALLSRSGSHKCEMSTTTNGVTTSGVIYVSNGNVRGDFSSVVPQYGTIASHMISKDGFVYTWTSMSSQGFKFPMSVDGAVNTSGNTQADALLKANYSYSCTPTTVASSQFELPANIKF